MPLSIGKVIKINVDLCGSIPRSSSTSSCSQVSPPDSPSDTHEVSTERGAHFLRKKLVELTSSDLNSLIGSQTCNRRMVSTLPLSQKGETSCAAEIQQQQDNTIKPSASTDTLTNSTTMRAPPALVDPPQWAVPAKGQARLEPVCEALGTHPVVDLTTRSHFRIGRSPNSDVQLWHETSSRRHALMFHHPNGSCYIVDCGSAHGTYVNGKRVRSTPLFGENSGGKNMIVPHRVKRGALIRFGGPGAPAFVLKSFSTGMSSKIVNLITADNENESDSMQQHSSVVVQSNTRLNALGNSSTTSILRKRFHTTLVEESDDSSVESVSNKRQRLCSSPPPESTQEERIPFTRLRLVSPDNITKPSITERLPELASVMKEPRRVTFSKQEQTFYPALVSPEELTDDDKSV